MYWLDSFTFDDSLLNSSFVHTDSNGELSDNTQHRLSRASSSSATRDSGFRSSSSSRRSHGSAAGRGLSATSKAKRRRHAHYKLNTRLDRKSSRGMIYENEELRLRTININAEVERGQSDIKRLRKENEVLRREIWTLRDECDRLNKRVKTKFIEHEKRCSAGSGGNCSGNCSCRCNNDGGGGGGGCEPRQSKCYSEDSDSCTSCCCHEEEDEFPCTQECCNDLKTLSEIAINEPEITQTHGSSLNSTNVQLPPTTSVLTNFDHLSVVSEETLSNSDMLQPQSENLLGYTPDLSGSQSTLPSLVGPLTPLTPIELVANELNDLQAVVPPLSYFENILQEHMGSTMGTTPETKSSSSGKTVIRHTNGWDYNLQSPFANRRQTPTSISPILSQRPTTQTLTTFVPTTTITPPPPSDAVTSPTKSQTNGKRKNVQLPVEASSGAMTLEVPVIETVPITTMPTNGSTSSPACSSILPRHFFAPIKPKLKLNTALANQKRLPPPPPPPIASSSNGQSSTNIIITASLSSSHPYTNGIMPQKTDPPDIYVTNALASPYKSPLKAPTTQPPAVPQRASANSASAAAAQVSPQHHMKLQRQHNLHVKHLHRCRQHQQQQQQQLLEFAKCIRNVAGDAAGNDEDVQRGECEPRQQQQQQYTILCLSSASCATTTSTMAENLSSSQPNFMLLTTNATAPLAACTTTSSTNIALNLTPIASTRTTNILSLSLSSCSYASSSPCLLTTLDCNLSPASFKFVNSNVNVTKANEPVYAVAQSLCHNLITAPAVTQPLMSATVKYCAKQQQFLMDTVKMLPVVDCSTVATTAAATATETLATSNSKESIGGVTATIALCNLTMNCSNKLINDVTDTVASATLTTATVKGCCQDSECQTDSANLEAILSDIEAISEDILAIQMDKSKAKPALSNNKNTTSNNTVLEQSNKNSKPYKSEMNLLLTFDGDNPRIQQMEPKKSMSNDQLLENNGSNTSTARRTRSLERDHSDTPSPHIPDPMQPFPADRKYIGFERLNKQVLNTSRAPAPAPAAAPSVAVTATQTSPVLNKPPHRAHLPLSPLVTNINLPYSSSTALNTDTKTVTNSPNGKSLPPTPPARAYPSPLSMRCAGIGRSSSVTTQSTRPQSPTLNGMPPSKLQLYASLATAAARRAQFRSQPTHLTKSLDTDCMLSPTNDELENREKEAAARKSRRVSIVCGDTDSPGTPDKPPIKSPNAQHTPTAPTVTSGSCSDIPSVMPNPALRSIKQTSHSTPSSPHSIRKHEGSPLSAIQPPTISVTPTDTCSPQHQQRTSHSGSGGGVGGGAIANIHLHHAGHGNAISNANATGRKNSHDTIRASATELANAAANAIRSKCSRRHSEGTVSQSNQRISGTSGGTNGGSHHHTHHNHHHHQHSASNASNANNPHHSHHSRQDSNHETMASFSDRNSSLASSRESSASFSMRSQRRKLSVSSHTGGKIPWCGCWGNGCL